VTAGTATNGNILQLDDVHTFYGTIEALKGISIEVRQGEIVTLIGANGAGKSTTLRSINGLNRPRQGSIRFQGRELRGLPSHRIAQAGIGYVPQGRRLFPSLTVDEHLRMVRGRSGGARRWTAERVYELFPQLRERRHVSGTALSGGEQQMLAIARALLTDPAMLLMDEPSEGLAPTVVETVVETCRALVAEGVGLLLVEQNLRVATALADRLLVMVSGRIAHETTAQALLGDEEAQRRFLGVEPLEAAAG
jgi:branched-chain amino acid transport system ATP-binding protein